MTDTPTQTAQTGWRMTYRPSIEAWRVSYFRDGTEVPGAWSLWPTERTARAAIARATGGEVRS